MGRKGDLTSLNYERVLWRDKKNILFFPIGVGASFNNQYGDYGDDWHARMFFSTLVCVGGKGVYGELGVSYNYIFGEYHWESVMLEGMRSHKHKYLAPQLDIRYHPRKSGFFARLTAYIQPAYSYINDRVLLLPDKWDFDWNKAPYTSCFGASVGCTF